ncbi:hypothetical protein GCM10009531_17940 [Actinoplanes capillaceus]
MSARAVTAAAGDHPASSSGLTNAPEVLKVAAEVTAAASPMVCDGSFTAIPLSWAMVHTTLTLSGA